MKRFRRSYRNIRIALLVSAACHCRALPIPSPSPGSKSMGLKGLEIGNAVGDKPLDDALSNPSSMPRKN